MLRLGAQDCDVRVPRPLRSREGWGISARMAAGLLSVVLGLWVPASPADVVVLHSGERIEGQIVGGTGNHVYLRRPSSTGGTYVHPVDRDDIAEIERDPAATRPADDALGDELDAGPAEPDRAPAPVASAEPTAPSTGSPPAELTADVRRALIMAIAKWRAQDFKNAGMDLSRLINFATPDERDAMSALALSTTQKTLAELAADAHMRAAIAARRGPAIRVLYVTEYEKPALLPMLDAAFEAALNDRSEKPEVRFTPAEIDPSAREAVRSRPVSAAAPDRSAGSPRPWYEAYAQSRPEPVVEPAAEPDAEAERVYAVIDWLGRPDDFKGTRAQARALAPRVHLARSLLNERIRLDSTLRRDANLKRRLMADRSRLDKLSKVVADHSGKTPPRSPAAIQAAEAERIRREELLKWQEEQQKEQAQRLADAQETARKWQEDEEKARKRGGWFDWLKPVDPNPAGSGQP